jgi:phosphomannomutase
VQASNNLSPVLHVPCQQHPDPSFPTVKFPNPEEKGALDESMAFATQHDCRLIIANDPDADRLAAAERLQTPSGEPSWRLFTGNEIGILLGHYQIQQYVEAKKNSTVFATPIKPAAVVTTVVSSKMLKKIADMEGVTYSDTLTGFKWIGNECIRLQSDGFQILFSYEEALGIPCRLYLYLY